MLTGSLAMRYAILLGPIALVQGIMGAQPMIVLALAGLLAFAFPHMRQHRKKSKNRLAIELVAMGTIVVGGLLIMS